jgi:tRNA dimethylallyltransferase
VTKPKIIIIVGPTASGKTGLAIELAKKFDGEVVSADSRQVYKGLDIGSAKVTPEEMEGVPHHLLDVANPEEVYTAADYKRDATKATEDILARGKLPIICGGTFFYIDTLLGKVSIPGVEPDEELRAILEEKSAAELFSILQSLDPNRAANIEKDNPRRLIRAIEIAQALGKVPLLQESPCPYDVLTIGLKVDMKTHGEILKRRIMERLDAGMITEVERLIESGVTHDRLEAFGLEYRYLSRWLRGLLTRDQMIEELTTKSRQFAKRQLTWLKRDDSIRWFDNKDRSITATVESFLKGD